MTQPLPSEPVRHEQIDAMLRVSGWAVQSERQLNWSAARGLAVWALVVKGGEADYALSLGDKLDVVLDAKRGGDDSWRGRGPDERHPERCKCSDHTFAVSMCGQGQVDLGNPRP